MKRSVPNYLITQLLNYKLFAVVMMTFVVGANIHAQWSAPPGPPTGGNPPPPVWIQTISPGQTQPGNIHIGNKAMVDGDIQVGGNGTVTGILGLGGAPDTSLGRKLDVNSSGAWGAVIRNGTAVALGIAPSFIGTITSHPLQIWTNNDVRMLIDTDGDVGINQLLPAHKLDVGGDINTTGVYRVGTTAGINLAAPCAAGDVLKGVNVKGGIITAGSCASDATGGGGGGTVTSVTGTPPISVATGTTTPVISLSGTVGLGNGGTGANLSATGGAGQFVKQSTAGGAFTVGMIVPADIPDLGGSYIQNQTAAVQPAGFNISGNGFVGGNVGIGTTAPASKLHVLHPSGTGVRITDGTTGFAVYNNSGSFIGTNTNHALFLMTNFNTKAILTGSPTGAFMPGQLGIGVNPIFPTQVNARMVVCRTGTPGSTTDLCTITTPANPVVVAVGSPDNGISSVSIRARGAIASGGADVGEHINVVGSYKDYHQGDVLVISKKYPGKFEKSRTSYDGLVAGIVTTTAGLVAGGGDETLSPVVMVLAGQVPARASTENGVIAIGDLLTSSSTQGVLMKCPTDTQEQKLRCMGAVVAKALEPLSEQKEIIKVLLTLQ